MDALKMGWSYPKLVVFFVIMAAGHNYWWHDEAPRRAVVFGSLAVYFAAFWLFDYVWMLLAKRYRVSIVRRASEVTP